MDAVSTHGSVAWMPAAVDASAASADIASPPEHEVASRRERWLAAATTVTRDLLVDPTRDPLDVIARTIRDAAQARCVNFALPTHDGRHVMIEVAVGAEELVGTTYSIEGSMAGRAIETGRTVVHRATGLADPPEWDHLPETLRRLGSVIAVPLLGPMPGALCIARAAEDEDFVAVDVEMAGVFANHAALALELADGREKRHRVDILEERARLAGDLHDHIIQRLFAVALRLELAVEEEDEDTATEVAESVTSIREAISELRTTIGGLRSRSAPTVPTSLWRRIEHVVEETQVLLPRRVRLAIDGPIEQVADHVLADDIVAVVRESLSNAGRHADATEVDVTVLATEHSVTVEVLDDGVGVGTPVRRSGLDNLIRRAERHGGTFTADEVRPGTLRPGTRVRWTCRIDA